MADSDKNILITPSVGATTEPTIRFVGADNNPVTVHTLDDGTLSFEASSGQLFSVNDNLAGDIFSVADVSGIPSITVKDTGVLELGAYGGRTLIGTIIDNGNDELQAAGSVSFYGSDGQTFHVSDTQDDTIFSVNDVSGIPNIRVDDSNGIHINEYAIKGKVHINKHDGNVYVGNPSAPQLNTSLQVVGKVFIDEFYKTGETSASTVASLQIGRSQDYANYDNIGGAAQLHIAGSTNTTTGFNTSGQRKIFISDYDNDAQGHVIVFDSHNENNVTDFQFLGSAPNYTTGSNRGLAKMYTGGFVHAATQPAFEGSRAQNNVIADATAGDKTGYTITGYTEAFDTTGDFDPSAGVYTIPTDGKYLFYAWLEMADGNGGDDSVGMDLFSVNNATPSSVLFRINNMFITRLGIEHTYTWTRILNLSDGDNVRLRFGDWNSGGKLWAARFGGYKLP